MTRRPESGFVNKYQEQEERKAAFRMIGRCMIKILLGRVVWAFNCIERDAFTQRHWRHQVGALCKLITAVRQRKECKLIGPEEKKDD
jgi:hypothetical protein